MFSRPEAGRAKHGRSLAGDILTRGEAHAVLGARDDALRAHATQVDPDGNWFAVPLELASADGEG